MYIDLYDRLKESINYTENEIRIDDRMVVHNFDFHSDAWDLLPGGAQNPDNYEFYATDAPEYEPDVIQRMLNKCDPEITENIDFRYQVFRPAGKDKLKHAVLFFHGFNEKNWAKYLTWAKRLTEITQSAVVLFPIAFHMNRAPLSWSNSRQMYAISEQRKKRHPEIISSTLSNVAISTRLHNKPQRFIWSGLQTYYDVIKLVEEIKSGIHPDIDKTAFIDFFSYSIGSLLAEILMMTNPDNYFSRSRLCMFCGGAVFNRLSPVSKFILDSEANVSLYSFAVEHLESHMKRDAVLNAYLGGKHRAGTNFRSMLNYKILTEYRESLFRALSDRLLAVTLQGDTVIPPYEVVNTLQGVRRDIPVKVDILDFPYPYKHEDPFPALSSIAAEVDKAFDLTFEKIGLFLRRAETRRDN